MVKKRYTPSPDEDVLPKQTSKGQKKIKPGVHDLYKRKKMRHVFSNSKSEKVRFAPVSGDILNPRVGPDQFTEAMKHLSVKQKEALDEMGFGSLASLNINKIPCNLGYWLLSNYDHQTCKLNLGTVVIKVTRKKVVDLLGIPSGGVRIVEKDPRVGTGGVKKFQKQYRGVDRLYLKHVTDEIKFSKKANTVFKLNFLVSFNSIFCKVTKSSTLNQRFLHVLKNMEDIPSFDWAGYLIENLNYTRKSWVHGEKFEGPITFLAALFVMEMKKQFLSCIVDVPHLPFVRQQTLSRVSKSMANDERLSVTKLIKNLEREVKYHNRQQKDETNGEGDRVNEESCSENKRKRSVEDTLDEEVDDDDNRTLLESLRKMRSSIKVQKLQSTENDPQVGNPEGDVQYKDGGNYEQDGGGHNSEPAGKSVCNDEDVPGDDEGDDNVQYDFPEVSDDVTVVKPGSMPIETDGASVDEVPVNQTDNALIMYPDDYEIPENCIDPMSLIGRRFYQAPPVDPACKISTKSSDLEKLADLREVDVMLDQLVNVLNGIESTFKAFDAKYPGDEDFGIRKKDFEDLVAGFKRTDDDGYGNGDSSEKDSDDKADVFNHNTVGDTDKSFDGRTGGNDLDSEETVGNISKKNSVNSEVPVVNLESSNEEERGNKDLVQIEVLPNLNIENPAFDGSCDRTVVDTPSSMQGHSTIKPLMVTPVSIHDPHVEVTGQELKGKGQRKVSIKKRKFATAKKSMNKEETELWQYICTPMVDKHTDVNHFELIDEPVPVLTKGMFECFYTGCYISANVITAYVYVLNHEEMLNKDGSPRRLYCVPNMLGYEKGDITQKSNEFIDSMDRLVHRNGLNEIQDVKLLFLPLCQGNHYVVFVFDLTVGTFVIIDNLKVGEEEEKTPLDKYDGADKLTQVVVCDYLYARRHPVFSTLKDASPNRIAGDWMTESNDTDCGVFCMRAMETYYGDPKWCMNGLVVEGDDQRKQLKALRGQYMYRILYSEINIHRTMVKLCAEKWHLQGGWAKINKRTLYDVLSQRSLKYF